MSTGTVKWFNPTKGFGFIVPDAGGGDVFLHITALQKANIQAVNEGDRVRYELVNHKGKTSAGELHLLETA